MPTQNLHLNVVGEFYPQHALTSIHELTISVNNCWLFPQWANKYASLLPKPPGHGPKVLYVGQIRQSVISPWDRGY